MVAILPEQARKTLLPSAAVAVTRTSEMPAAAKDADKRSGSHRPPRALPQQGSSSVPSQSNLASRSRASSVVTRTGTRLRSLPPSDARPGIST